MIREGSPPGAGGMPGWDDKLTNQEIADVIVWIKSTWSEEIYGTWYQEIEKNNNSDRERNSINHTQNKYDYRAIAIYTAF